MRRVPSRPAYLLCGLLATPAPAAAGVDEAAALAADTVPALAFVEPAPPPVTAFAPGDDGAGDLSRYAGEVVVLNMWATWCAPCRREMPSLQRLQDRMGDEGLEVVTIAFGRHNPAAMERFWEEAGVTSLPLHLDASTELARGLGVVGLPHTAILDREGRVVAHLAGEADWDAPEMVAVLRALSD